MTGQNNKEEYSEAELEIIRIAVAVILGFSITVVLTLVW